MVHAVYTTLFDLGSCRQLQSDTDSLRHLDDKVYEKGRKAHLESARLMFRLTPKKCSALSLTGSSGSGAMPNTPSRRTHAAVMNKTA